MPVKKQSKEQCKAESILQKSKSDSLKSMKLNPRHKNALIQHQAILDNIPDMAWLKDKKGRFTLSINHLLEVCGMDEKDLIGKTDLDVWPRDLAEKYLADDLKVIESMKRFMVEEAMINSKGEIIYVQTFKAPLMNQAGEVIGTTGISRDITESKKAREALKKSEEQFHKLSAYLHRVREEDRSRLSREINEELGQILSILKFDLDWIEKKLNGKQKSILEKTQSISKLIASMLEWVRRISQELRPSILDILGLIPAMEWELAELEKRTGIGYKLTVSQSEIDLEEYVSTGLFRILQEILNHMLAYSQIKYLNISLNVKNSLLILNINGKQIGFSQYQI